MASDEHEAEVCLGCTRPVCNGGDPTCPWGRRYWHRNRTNANAQSAEYYAQNRAAILDKRKQRDLRLTEEEKVARRAMRRANYRRQREQATREALEREEP